MKSRQLNRDQEMNSPWKGVPNLLHQGRNFLLVWYEPASSAPGASYDKELKYADCFVDSEKHRVQQQLGLTLVELLIAEREHCGGDGGNQW